MQIFRIAYSHPVPSMKDEYQKLCQDFVIASSQCMPSYSKRSKVHLLLHLTDHLLEFGPATCFSTERYTCILMYMTLTVYCRYEAFNAFIRSQNIYSNRLSQAEI